MAGAVQFIAEGYKYVFHDLMHPTTRNWFLIGSPHSLLMLLAFYLYFCLSLGPSYMKNRKAYELKNVIKFYNIFQILASLYLFVKGSFYIFTEDFSFLCQPLEDPTSPRAREIVPMTYIYFSLKIIDLLDTVFFVLRKSDRQITSLHLHHHTLMPMSSWIAVSYFPGGQAVFVGYLNAFVHAVMYSYYLIAGLGAEYKKYLWWKKYLTTLQLTQFAIVAVHSFIALFHECGFPNSLKLLMLVYACIFMYMFGNFYYYSYVKNKNSEIHKNGTKTTKIEKMR